MICRSLQKSLGTVLSAFYCLGVAMVRKTHPMSFILQSSQSSPGECCAYLIAFLSCFADERVDLGGFEAAANVAEETHFPEKRIPMAILMAEVWPCILGLAGT